MSRLSFVAVALLTSTPALAGGFLLQEQSGVGVGRAFAGEAALGRDASTVWFNPAGMTLLGRPQVQVGEAAIFVESRQQNRGSTRGVPGVGQVPTGGGNGGNPFDPVVGLPDLHLATPLTRDGRLWAGLSVTAPFGLNVRYQDGWFGRYDSIKSEVITYNFQPSLAYRVTNRFSVGGGVDVQYIDAVLTSAIPNLSPLQPDGDLRIQGSDWSVGWNAGVLLNLGHARFGAHYRSRMGHELEGFFRVRGLAGPLAAGNRRVGALAPITLPDYYTVSAVYDRDGWRGLFSANYYNWSTFRSIDVFAQQGRTPLASSPQNYRNSFSVHGGIERDLSPKLTLRAGAAYDTTPTTDAFRTTRVPDGDRIWAAAGADYRVGRWTLSGSYAHVFVSSEPINRTDPLFQGTPAATTATTLSTNRGSVNIVALAATRAF